MNKPVSLAFLLMLTSCSAHIPSIGEDPNRLIPAEEFSKRTREGDPREFSIYRVAQEAHTKSIQKQNAESNGAYQGDPRYLEQGMELRKTLVAPVADAVGNQQFVNDGAAVSAGETVPVGQPLHPPHAVLGNVPGSFAPYALGHMSSNPSLWPDEAQGGYLFSDFRAVQAMDVITIVVNESADAKKKAETDSKSEFSILAGIQSLFGIETKSWASNNEGLDPEALIQATTTTDFKGEGETKRQGTLKARISAVVMEVLPNGLLRLEGTKILSLNAEEEIMVISGLVRPRDVTADNQVDSSRIANMRIDFYGRGTLGQQQSQGWGVRIFETVWPF